MIFATIGDDCIANEIFRLSPSTFITSKGVKLGKLSSLINDQSSQVSQNENKNSQLSQLSIVKYQLLINFQFSQFSTSFNILSSVYLFSLFVSHLNFSMVQFVCCLGGTLRLRTELGSQVLQHNAIGGRKEGQDMSGRTARMWKRKHIWKGVEKLPFFGWRSFHGKIAMFKSVASMWFYTILLYKYRYWLIIYSSCISMSKTRKRESTCASISWTWIKKWYAYFIHEALSKFLAGLLVLKV